MSRISYRNLVWIVAAGLSALLWAPSAAGQEPLDPDREAAAVEFLSNGIPEQVEHLQELKRHRPEEYWQELQRGLLEKADVERARVEDPDRYRQFMAERKLDRHSFELARQIRDSGEGEAPESLVRELRQALGDLFDLRERWRTQEIENLQRELERLRREGEQRRLHRDEIIRRRIEVLTGLAELYAW